MSQTFAVWAPLADTVHLHALGTDHEMTAAEDGWWSVDLEVPAVADGIDYGFRIDGGDPRPDPRSRRQPDGVHGLSRTFDPAAHRWHDGLWAGRRLAGSVVYEMHVGTFTPEGTFDAAIGKLEHLTSIGVDMVEVLPVNGFNGTHNWGYDGVLWYAVHESYGGPAGYQRFVDACHQRGIGVIQDVVYNHLGASGNYLIQYGPYLHDDGRANTWGAGVNLDGPQSDEVRRYILDNVDMWLREYHVDGLRLDAVHALQDTNAVHLLEEIAIRVDALAPHVRRPLSLIAESDLNDPKMIMPRETGGYGLTAQWNDDFHHVLHVALTGETTGYYADFGPVSAIAKVLTHGFFHDGTHSSFRGRDHGRPVDVLTVPTWRFVGYSQNHDQIGNRAAGDRLEHQASFEHAVLAATLVLTGPFTPMLFQGEEWAASTPWPFFTSHPEPELGEATREGRFKEFERMGWDRSEVPDPQDPQTFASAKLRWAERSEGRHARMLDVYRRLLAVRRARPELTDPRFPLTSVEFDDDARWLLIDRSGVRVAVNLADEERTLPLATPVGPVLFVTDPAVADGLGATDGALTLPARSAVVMGPPHRPR